MRIRIRNFFDPGSRMEKIRIRVNNPDPQHWKGKERSLKNKEQLPQNSFAGRLFIALRLLSFLYCIFCCLWRFCGRAKRKPHCGQGSSLSRWWTWRRWRVRTARLANRRGHWSQACGRGFSCLNFMWLRKFRGTLMYSRVWMRLPIRWIRIRSYVIVLDQNPNLQMK